MSCPILKVVGARCLRDYSLQGQVATGGLHGVWKIFAARSKKDGEQELRPFDQKQQQKDGLQ